MRRRVKCLQYDLETDMGLICGDLAFVFFCDRFCHGKFNAVDVGLGNIQICEEHCQGSFQVVVGISDELLLFFVAFGNGLHLSFKKIL